ncbi:VPS10 domain-containing receptor SorCS1 [Thelohanellus kitauei]|uniref:VPS10 domain-containing receptor SorCS1 n=1 Tax=Thelohanellus kitauei TaxID=669202 RepID=A0A0C2MUI1_THEKT|nr:VPS10 domain-containing receptor SorCS1 [Thelohanellus kitauei]
MIIEENLLMKIYYSYEELEAPKDTETVEGHSYDIYRRLLDNGTDDRNFSVCQDKQDKLMYLLEFDSSNIENSLGLFMINISTHKIYKINIAYGEERDRLTLSGIWCAYGGLIGYDDENREILIKMKGDREFLGYHLYDEFDNIFLDDRKIDYIDHDSLGYVQNHLDESKYFYVLEGYPGVVILTKTVIYLGKQILKTFISYTNGKNWAYLQLKNKQNSPCESEICDISILPGDKRLSDVLKYSPLNPLLIVAPCTITIHSMELDTRLMISDDGGFTWIYTYIKFISIEILKEGEILVANEDNKYLHVSLDTGRSWQKLNERKSNDKIIQLIPDTEFKYNVVMVSKNDASGYYISTIDFSGIFSKSFA